MSLEANQFLNLQYEIKATANRLNDIEESTLSAKHKRQKMRSLVQNYNVLYDAEKILKIQIGLEALT